MIHVKYKTPSNSNAHHGFTMIELMLAMTFVSVLLVAIVMTTIQISHIYTRGLTFKEVNQVGRSVTEDLQQVIASSRSFNVDPTSAATRYIINASGGRLCTGRYSYVWNYGEYLTGLPASPPMNKYNGGSAVRFAKVNDQAASLCTSPTSDVVKTDATELLSAGDRALALHAFTITSAASDVATEQTLYAISLLIGTNDQNQLVTNDTSCRPPSDQVGQEDYCTVNQFDIVVRASNKSGGE